MKEKMSRPCLQEQTGSCYGCPVITDTAKRIKNALNTSSKGIKHVRPDETMYSGKDCPPGYTIQAQILANKVAAGSLDIARLMNSETREKGSSGPKIPPQA